MGAIGEGDVRWIDWQVVSDADVTANELARAIERERLELGRRVNRLRRSGHPRLDISGRTVIVVDDGIATGSTATAAIRVARDLGARRVILATPVGPRESVDRLARIADEDVVSEMPSSYLAVGQVYSDFTETSDDEVVSILDGMRSDLSAEETDLVRSA